jgi:hypothetical protein
VTSPRPIPRPHNRFSSPANQVRMVRSALLFDTPLLLRSRLDLHSTKSPLYLRDAESKAKQVVLRQMSTDVVVIRAAEDDAELVVGTNGGCFFESPLLGLSEQFWVEPLTNGSLVFVSCRTGNVLGSDARGLPHCADTIRQGWFIAQPGVDHHPVAEATPVEEPPCEHCRDHEASERRAYIMQLAALGKTVTEIDEILLRMYAWPTEETIEKRQDHVDAPAWRVKAE